MAERLTLQARTARREISRLRLPLPSALSELLALFCRRPAVYMALIDPFRKWIVCPSLLRSVHRPALPKASPVDRCAPSCRVLDMNEGGDQLE
jgi:hypothetical protein